MADAIAKIAVITAEVDMNRDLRQHHCGNWVRAAFGNETMRAPDERAARVLEEAVELAQALGVTKATADKIVSYVFDRPIGNPMQEAGGVGITLLACCEAIGISADETEAKELRRVLSKPLSHFADRQVAKRALGITPAIRSNDVAEIAAERRRQIMVEALQTAWDGFCEDTGCFPDCFKFTRGKLYANFTKGPFAEMVVAEIDRLDRAAGGAEHG